MVAVGDAVRTAVFRPLAGDDKIEILAIAQADRNLRDFRGAVPRLLPDFFAPFSGIARFRGGSPSGGSPPRRARTRRARRRDRCFGTLPLQEWSCGTDGSSQIREGVENPKEGIHTENQGRCVIHSAPRIKKLKLLSRLTATSRDARHGHRHGPHRRRARHHHRRRTRRVRHHRLRGRRHRRHPRASASLR